MLLLGAEIHFVTMPLRSCCLGLEIITTKKLVEDHFLSGILLELTMVYQPSRYDIL